MYRCPYHIFHSIFSSSICIILFSSLLSYLFSSVLFYSLCFFSFFRNGIIWFFFRFFFIKFNYYLVNPFSFSSVFILFLITTVSFLFPALPFPSLFYTFIATFFPIHSFHSLLFPFSPSHSLLFSPPSLFVFVLFRCFSNDFYFYFYFYFYSIPILFLFLLLPLSFFIPLPSFPFSPSLSFFSFPPLLTNVFEFTSAPFFIRSLTNAKLPRPAALYNLEYPCWKKRGKKKKCEWKRKKKKEKRSVNGKEKRSVKGKEKNRKGIEGNERSG